MKEAKDSPTTKRLLVAFDPKKPTKSSRDFLVPVLEEERYVLFGTKSKGIVLFGMVVFVGREFTVNDVFARLVDAGRRIPGVAKTLGSIGEYLRQINEIQIGQVVEIVGTAEGDGFTLKTAEGMRPPTHKPLP